MTATSVELAIDPRFQQLQAYLQEGWTIDPPVFVRPVWHTQHKQKEAYHFILKRAEALHLLVIPVSAEIDEFLKEQALPLNRL